MEEGTIGRRWARALADTLSEGKTDAAVLGQVEAELSALAKVFADKQGDFRQAMLDPSFTIEQRSSVLKEIAESNKFHEVSGKFLQLLVAQDRVRYLGDIAKAFQHEVDERTGRVRAVLTSAKPLSDGIQKDIVSALEKRTGKTVLAEVNVDESVISGVRAQIGGTVFDGTVRAQLDRLRGSLAT